MADPEPDAPPGGWDRPPPLPTWGDLVARLLGADRRRLAAVAAALLVVAGAAAGGYALLRTPSPPPVEDGLPLACAAGAAPGDRAPAAGCGEPGAAGSPAPGAPTSTTAPGIVVHAAGAVAVPGLHDLPAGARVADVLAAAGGPVAGADLDRVNLAAPVADGERVWFPRMGEEPPPVAVGSGGAGSGSGTAAASGPVDLNTADVAALDALPGIGPSIAAAIVEHRERAGPFRSVEDLLDVPGIGEAKLAQLRDLVRV